MSIFEDAVISSFAVWGIVIGVLIIGALVTLWCVIAARMSFVAKQKGYAKGAHAFALSFLFGIVGWIYAAALPDKAAQDQNDKLLDFLKRQNADLQDNHDKLLGMINYQNVKLHEQEEQLVRLEYAINNVGNQIGRVCVVPGVVASSSAPAEAQPAAEAAPAESATEE